MLHEIDEASNCIRLLIVDDNLIEKTRIHIQKAMFFIERIKITSYTFYSLLEDHILNQMSSTEGGITDKTEVHIERSNQFGRR